jgi:hypothetical protein
MSDQETSSTSPTTSDDVSSPDIRVGKSFQHQTSGNFSIDVSSPDIRVGKSFQHQTSGNFSIDVSSPDIRVGKSFQHQTSGNFSIDNLLKSESTPTQPKTASSDRPSTMNDFHHQGKTLKLI